MPASNSPDYDASGSGITVSPDNPNEITFPTQTIRGSVEQPIKNPDILTSILQAGRKLPGQLAGAPIDIANLIGGGYANIVDAIRGKEITRSIGEGLVPKPIGGSQQINTDIVGLPASGGLAEDLSGLGLNIATNPIGAVKTVGAVGGLAALGFRALTGGARTAETSLPAFVNAQRGLIVAAESGGKSPEDIRMATKMLDAGADPAEVFQQTGIYKGPLDGKMRTVMNDNNSVINPMMLDETAEIASGKIQLKPGVNSLDEILGHPAAFDAYPELKDVSVTSDRNLAVGAAQTWSSPAGTRIVVGPQTSVAELHSTLLHEVQHVVQDTEGFMNGANPGQFLPGGSAQFNASLSKIQEIAGQIKSNLASRIGVSEETIAKWGAAPSSAPPGVQALDDFQTYIKTRAAQAKAFATKRNAQFSYEMVAGEAEARSVQSAFDLGQTNDKLFFPLDLYQTMGGTPIKTSDLIAAPTAAEKLKVTKP